MDQQQRSSVEFRSRRGTLLSLGLALAACTLSVPSPAQDLGGEDPARLPASVGALGDSMTAAAFAGYKRQHSVFPWVMIGLLANALQYGATKDIHSIEHRKYSWVTGGSIPSRQMPSHWSRLNALSGQSLPYYNASLSGAESDHVLKEQLLDLKHWSQRNLDQEYPDYVTVLIGANDLCANNTDEMLSTEEFFSNVQNSVHEILRASPRSKVMISSLPNVSKLRDIAKGARVFGGLKCEQVWKKAKLCKTLTTLNDPEAREIVAQRLWAFNIALREIVEIERRQYGDRVRFSKNLYEQDFGPKDLAIDCFHPNKAGQAMLSESVFQSSWWNDSWIKKREELKKEFLAEQKRQCRPKPGEKAGQLRPSICFQEWK